MRKYVIILLIFVGCFMLFHLAATGVCHVREVAVSSGCTNNLKQIAIAMQAYTDIHGVLPEGTIPNERLEPHQRLSWIAMLLPFIE